MRHSKILLKLKYQDITEWDSVGHMSLIAALEDTFDIMMDMGDIIVLSLYEKGIFAKVEMVWSFKVKEGKTLHVWKKNMPYDQCARS